MVSFKSILLFTGLGIAAPAPEGEKQLTKRFNGGWCGVHIHMFDGENEKGTYEMNVYVYDGKQQLIWFKESIWGTGTLMAETEGLPAVLNINAHGSGDDIATFTYGDQAWGAGKPGTKNDKCSVGQWDSPSWTSTTSLLEMDCGFSC
ncbi:hypothetical protein F53441_1948 [Fusarium austroafricanum]|uniref:Uncharacterized protein n=1 Tax=Fusarium austroafricanum TaxID=2364996 RepID=A0A8H4KU56_9HYPO|nr:hypothetical protein F53441_1948 [Fusarium austroafricanum]